MADGDPIVLGRSNDSAVVTTINCNGTGTAAFWVQNDNGLAVYGQAALGGAGVTGYSDSGAGVAGQSDSAEGVVGESGRGIGVSGRGDDYVGVRGESNAGAGVVGTTGTGRGVHGQALQPGGEGVFGYARSGAFGVHGLAPEAVGVRGSGGQVGVVGAGLGSGVGVRADSAGNDAMVGTSSGARGVVGTTLSPAGTGVHGVATSGGNRQVGVRGSSSAGFGLLASSTTGIAGAFIGSVVVVGDFFAVGGFKSAAVAHPDGTHRLTYCVESPECWFEDFGRARLTGGRGEVRLDPDFAALVRTDDFHVFLTAEGETTGLYVADRSEAGFEVREQRGGDGEVPFSYRIVARRSDVDAVRLASVDLPDIPAEPEAVAAPELPDQSALPPEWPPRPLRRRES
jgi:hypothetical protein